MEKETSTSGLLHVLQSTPMSQFARYRQEHLAQAATSFVAYMDGLIAEKGLKRQDIFQRADLDQKYGYKLLTGERHTNDRDKLMRMFFAMELSLRQVQRALELYGLPALYPRKSRDALLSICLNQGIHQVDRVNELLEEQGEAPLHR